MKIHNNETERIVRYINGEADQADIAWVEDLLSHGHENQNLKHRLERDWEDTLQEPYMKNVALNAMLDRVHHLIRKKESQKRNALIYRITHIYMKAAAALLLPLILAGGLYVGYLKDPLTMNSDQRGSSSIYAPMGSRISFCLPDGTKGWLNSGSTLTYPILFSKSRRITLEGEAWFDVVHHEEQPFEISAGESKIKVLGTSFNVSAYADEKYVEVVLQSGKVEFSDKSRTENVILKPCEQLILHDGRLEVSPVDASKYKAWTEGRLVFRGDNMGEVAKRIERWYHVKVEIADEDLNQFSFRATFVDDPLEDVLKQLSMTSPIQYQILPREQRNDGTYEKAKVVLYKSKTQL